MFDLSFQGKRSFFSEYCSPLTDLLNKIQTKTVMTITNIEIKARTGRGEAIRKILLEAGAEFRGTDHQKDTYFRVSSGRLKLREGNIENQLIHYRRADQEGPKQADVLLYPSLPGSHLKEILTTALGILVVVDKTREIYFIGNVKFHIDEVQGLGHFVEIEAIDREGTLGREKLLEQCQHYLSRFGITAEELVACSYSDLLLAKHTPQAGPH
jgi:predicted adenylyl cyclase CyaB